MRTRAASPEIRSGREPEIFCEMGWGSQVHATRASLEIETEAESVIPKLPIINHMVRVAQRGFDTDSTACGVFSGHDDRMKRIWEYACKMRYEPFEEPSDDEAIVEPSAKVWWERFFLSIGGL